MKNEIPSSALLVPSSKASAFWANCTVLILYCLPTVSFSQVDYLSAKSFAAKAVEKTRLAQADSAAFYTTRSLAFFQDKDYLNDWLQLHRSIGRIFRDEKNAPEQAMAWYEAAFLQAWRKPATEEEWTTWAFLHLSVGFICSEKRGDFICARDHYETGRAILQDTLHRADTIIADFVLRPLGNIHARFRDFEKALQYLRQAKTICEQQNNWNKAAIAANGIGMMYFTKGDYKAAAGWFQEGLKYKDLSPHARVTLYLNLGLTSLKNNEVEKAWSLTSEAKQLLEQYPEAYTNNDSIEHWADLHDNLGNIYQHRSQWQQAANHFQTFIMLLKEQFGTPSRREVAQGFLELCDLFTEWGQPDSTLRYAQAALRCLLPDVRLEDDFANPQPAQLYSEHTLYLVFEQKINALSALSARNPNDKTLLTRCLETCDLLFTTDEILRREYDFVESKLYRQDASRPYFEAALSAAYRLRTLTRDPTLNERAWQYSELARERLLVEQMRDRETAAQAPEAARQELARLRERRTKLQTQIFEKNIRGEADTPAADSLHSLIFETHLAWQGLLESIEPKDESIVQLPRTNPAALRGLLPPDEAMLEYFTGDNAIYVFVLTNQELRFLQCPRLLDLTATVQRLRESLTNKEMRDLEEDLPLFSQYASLLYDVLLAEPLNALPQSVKRLVIVPDGLLHNVPFELLGKDNGQTNFKTFPYLLRRYMVSYASSGSLLLRQSEAAHRPDTPELQAFLGFAPQYDNRDTLGSIASRTRALQVRSGSYPDLPESRKEVREIAELLQGKAHLGPEASERQFKRHASRSRILHLSMHTWLEERDPMFSKLLFTQNPQDTTEDNDLYAIELYDIRLNAQLAVLSACETGLGKIRQGEGVMSLARAFAYAGVPATLMSLWQVEDGATRSLMVDFYRHMKTGMRKDDALQKAKLNYLKNCEPLRASPYYWGGFVASGNMEPLSGR